MTTQHALAPAHAAMPKGPEGGGGDGDGGGGDGDGKNGGGEEVAPITRHITQNWRSPGILPRDVQTWCRPRGWECRRGWYE